MVVFTRSYNDENDTVNHGVSVAGGTATAAATNIPGATYKPRRRPCVLRVTVCLTVLDSFSAIINDGSNRTHTFNAGVNLVANNVYSFNLPISGVSTELTVDFQTGGINQVQTLTISEINEAA